MMIDQLGLTTPAPLSLVTLTINVLLGIVLASILAWFYARYGHALSNREKFAQVLPLLTMITVLVISVVKSSLALSLGLVGALSIMRFRTAIKEPEELIYLFMALAIGLGLGADQRWPTVLVVTLFLGYVLVRAYVLPRPSKNNLYLNIAIPVTEDTFTQLNATLLQHVKSADLHRLDRGAAGLQATYLIAYSGADALTRLMDALSAQFPESELSFVEQNTTLSG
jgi:hypothetical protein